MSQDTLSLEARLCCIRYFLSDFPTSPFPTLGRRTQYSVSLGTVLRGLITMKSWRKAVAAIARTGTGIVREYFINVGHKTTTINRRTDGLTNSRLRGTFVYCPNATISLFISKAVPIFSPGVSMMMLSVAKCGLSLWDFLSRTLTNEACQASGDRYGLCLRAPR